MPTGTAREQHHVEGAGGGTYGAFPGQGFPSISPEAPAKPREPVVSGYPVNKSHLQFLCDKYLSQE